MVHTKIHEKGVQTLITPIEPEKKKDIPKGSLRLQALEITIPFVIAPGVGVNATFLVRCAGRNHQK